MVIVIKRGTPIEEIEKLKQEITEIGLKADVSSGEMSTLMGLIGDTTLVDAVRIELKPFVERIIRVQEPYKRASRKFHAENSEIDVCGVKFGGKKVPIIAGPCSVESEEQITLTANEVKKYGASALRGGAFKPRTSPYAFQGMELEGLELLKHARKETGLPIVTEIMSPKHVEIFDRDVDVIQVGARNMQNFDLLKELGKTSKPILLKRGLSSTIEEWLMSAEYILAGGNHNVILCERGIRTFETYTRNTLDISAIPVIKKISHLPIIIDPSHSGGMSWLVAPLSMAAIAAGADGLIVEVHNDPKNAKCDGPQSLEPKQFADLLALLKPIAQTIGRDI